MEIDTQRLRQLAYGLMSRKRYGGTLKDPVQRFRHERIQEKLNVFIDHLNHTAHAYETADRSLFSNFRIYSKEGTASFYHSEDLNLISQLTKKEDPSVFSVGASWSFKEVGAVYQSKYLNASLQSDLGSIEAEGSCSIGLWKEGEFDPSLDLEAQLEASLVSCSAQARLGTANAYIQTKATGSIGTVYAKANCTLTKEEQKLEAGVGAAALRGEASLAFSLFGAKITLTAQGSIGSAEANVSYHHKNKEWEFSSKLGFIAGLGFKVNVKY